MISYIRGELVALEEDKVIVDVGGVGYGIFMSGQAMGQLPPVGSKVKIHTYLNVKEDAMQLYGFLNRILIPMINEAATILQEGIASIEDIDTAMKLGANHPMGPLALGDLIGLDIVVAIMDVLYAETHDSKYRCCTLLRKMVRGGKLGQKTGVGFYDYTK